MFEVFIVFVGAKGLTPSGANPGYGRKKLVHWRRYAL